jgi:hypothetical protein
MEKKSELKVAVGGMTLIASITLPAILVGLKAVLDAGLVASGTWAFVAVTIAVAAVSGAITVLSKSYVQGRTEVKKARAGASASINTKPPGVTDG